MLAQWRAAYTFKLASGYHWLRPDAVAAEDALFDFVESASTLRVDEIAEVRMKLNLLRWLARWCAACTARVQASVGAAFFTLAPDDDSERTPRCVEMAWTSLDAPAGSLRRWRFPADALPPALVSRPRALDAPDTPMDE